jgi:Plant transposon protein
LFAKHQEGPRKAVERVFGVLFKRFEILYGPSRLWFEGDMSQVIKACVIIHNMIVESRRDSYSGTRKKGDDAYDPYPEEISDNILISPPEERSESAEFWQRRLGGIEDIHEHMEPKNTLAKHIYENEGFQH